MEEPLEELSLGSSRANIPAGWSDRPETLGLGTTFTQERINEALHPSHQFSHAKPILKNAEIEYIFVEKGKYYLWNAVSDRVSEIREKSLNDIFTKLQDGGLLSLTLAPLRGVDDPWEPCSDVPYQPDPDFVDRPDITSKLTIPPQKYVLLTGKPGVGKSELAIHYANKVRKELPQTWVFWVDGSTKIRFDDDFAAIAEILPEHSYKSSSLDPKDRVLEWLCTPRIEPWLLVVDDLFGFHYTIPQHHFPLELLNCNNGSLVFTSAYDFTSSFPDMQDAESQTNLEKLMSSIQGKISILSVEEFLVVEADQLLRKKLKPAHTDVGIREVLKKIQLQPIAIELIATSLNRGLLSLSELTDMDMRGGAAFHLPFQRLWGSINLFWRTLLCFVAYFDPPEARKIWILSYLVWTNSETGPEQLDRGLKSLTELSLLKEVSNGSAYKMHKATRIMVLEGLRGEKGAQDFMPGIADFVDSRNFIPKPPSKYRWQVYDVFPE